MNKNFEYELVHFVVADEHLQPLLQSQVFEQAELQKTYKGNFKPVNVKVMYYCHYRDLFNGNNSKFLREYRQKFPSIQFVPIYRPIRFAKYVKATQIFIHLYSKNKIIIHCRGESAHKEIRTLPFLKYLNKKTILDVRGIWPYERLLHKGVKEFSSITPEDHAIFKQDIDLLENQVKLADGLSYVSKNLVELIEKYTGKLCTPNIIVPCVASRENYNINSSFKGDKYSEYFTIVYVGTDRSYQHLGDLVFPFVKLLMLSEARIKLKILSKDKDSILFKLKNLGLNMKNINVKSVNRDQVFQELVDCDLAILLREGNVVNKVSSPVKLGEYLACGLPILFQKDSIGFSDEILKNQLGIQVDLENQSKWYEEVKNVVQYLENKKSDSPKKMIQLFFNENYCWEEFIQIQRNFYKEIIEND